jgi:hypothetical protein
MQASNGVVISGHTAAKHDEVSTVAVFPSPPAHPSYLLFISAEIKSLVFIGT